MKQSKQPEANKVTTVHAKERHVPTPEERTLIDSFFAKRKEETPSPKIKAEKQEDGFIGIKSEHKDNTVAYALLAKAVGTTDAEFINEILTQLAAATTGKGLFIRLGLLPTMGALCALLVPIASQITCGRNTGLAN
jgi:hypothetical protein